MKYVDARILEKAMNDCLQKEKLRQEELRKKGLVKKEPLKPVVLGL